MPYIGINHQPWPFPAIASIVHEAAIFNRTNTHMQTTTTLANNERQEQLAALGFSGEEDYADHQRVMEKMRSLTHQHLKGLRSTAPKQLIHLSEIGINAGQRFCLAPRDGTSRSVHAMYAPLDNVDFRETVCAKCLSIWATEAYEDGDQMPEYIAEARAAVKLQRATDLAPERSAMGDQ